LVGNGEVGKTSIRLKLLDSKATLPKKKDRTQGLDIVPYELKALSPDLTGLEDAIDFQLNIWDFGGQGKYREVQQLFFSPQSLYLFVTACDDTPEDKESYVTFDYWMSLVHALSYDREQERSSPVIHVVNKIDKERMDIDQTAHNRFGNVEEFHAISCKHLTNFEALRKAIPRVLPKVGQGIFRDQYNEDWLGVMEELQRRQGEHHITYQEYRDEVCKDRLNDGEARAWLRILDRIGTVIYFGENEKLKDWIILNPNWVKQAVFEVIDSGERNPVPQWRFEKQIWSHYSEKEREKLFELLQAYDLAYKQQNAFGEQEFVVPALLEHESPNYQDLLPQEELPLKLRFAFKPILPAGTVNKLMVRLKDYIYRGLMWKDNVVFHHPDSNAYVQVEEDWQEHFIYLSVYGKQPSVIYETVTSTLKDINNDFKNAKFLKELEFTVEGFDGEEWMKKRLLKKAGADFFNFLWEKPGIHYKEEDEKNIMDQVKELIAKNRVGDALEMLKSLVPAHLEAEVLQLISRYSKLQRDSRMGILANNDENVERNRIVSSILNLASEAERDNDHTGLSDSSDQEDETFTNVTDQTKKILFICSSPSGKNLLDFGKEFKSIGIARQLADSRDDYAEPIIKTSVEADDLLHIMTKYQPDILHISLHSSKSKGLYFENNAGQAEPISAEDFKDIIETYASDPDGKGRIETIVLSCCDSEAYGRAITNFADHIVVTKDLFPDKAAVVYAKDFYRMLFNNKDIGFAHRSATSAIKRKKYPSDGFAHPIHEIPFLIKNDDK